MTSQATKIFHIYLFFDTDHKNTIVEEMTSLLRQMTSFFHIFSLFLARCWP